MQLPRIDPENAMGLADKVVGLGKEILGTVMGRDDIVRSGQVQQDKGSERIKAARAQIEAQAHEARAHAAGQTQQHIQGTTEGNQPSGIGEQLKGTVKEKVGDITGSPQLQQEGDAQQTKGEEQSREARERAEARAHEEQAAALDREQQSLQ